MSTPISEVPEKSDQSENATGTVHSIDSSEAVESSSAALEVEDEAGEDTSGGSWGLVALLLGLLLAGSVAMNLKQANTMTGLNAKSQEFELALTAAVERIDQEAARADVAESTLDGIGGAVETVNDRVASLTAALDELRAATAR